MDRFVLLFFILYCYCLFEGVYAYTWSANDSGRTVRVGGVFPITTLTDDVDPVGNQRMAGFMLAIKHLNEQYQSRNISVKVAVRDSKRSFTNTVKASMSLVSDAFDGHGVHGVVGAGTNMVSTAMAFILQDFDIIQMSYGSDASELGHASTYPDFMRVYPSASYQAHALVDIIYRYYRIPNVLLVHSTDIYGTDSLAVFEDHAGTIGGPEVLSTISVTVGQNSDYSAKIKAAMKLKDLRAVVLLVSNINTAANFLVQAYNEDLLHSRMFIFATSVVSSGSLWDAMENPKAASAIMESLIALAPADSDWKEATEGKEFISKFLAQDNTILKNSDGTEKCDNTTDDDGYYLYQAKIKVDGVYTYECTGVNFTALNKDGSDMANFAAYIYDATLALVQGIVSYADEYNDGVIPETISGTTLMPYIVDATSFDGATGIIEFQQETNIYDYGLGDRVKGVHFAVQKYSTSSSSSSSSSSSASYTMTRFGTWKSEGGFELATAEDPLRVVRIGGVFPMTTLTDELDPVGIQRLAAFVMAIEDLNAQYRQLNYTIKMAVRDSQRSFTNAAKASLALATSVFGTTGVHGAIGAGTNSVSEAMAFILQDSDIAQIAYASDASDLSHPDVYPNFLRVYHSSSFQGYALAELVFGQFGYKRVVVVYSTDVFGADALAEFNAHALSLERTALATIAIASEALADYSQAISTVRKYDPRIFVLLVENVEYAARFLRQAYDSGLISSGSLILGTSATTTPSLWKAIGDEKAASIIMGAYLGLTYTDSDWMVTAQGKEFLQRIRSQPSTTGYTDPTTGVTTCNNATDDDGGFYLYQALNIQGTDYECTGQVFSDYAANGVNMSHYSAYIYDATVAMVHGVIMYAQVHNGGLIPGKISGGGLKQLLITNITFEGESGLVSFASGRDGVYNYGLGDRTTGIRFALNDFTLGNGSMSQFGLVRVGTWRSEGGFVTCKDESDQYSFFAALTGDCTEFAHVLPPEHASFLVQRMPDSMRSGLFFLAALQLFVASIVATGLIYYRRTRLLKASQPPMMWLVLTMAIWGAARTVLAGSDVADEVCIADYWTGHLAFSGIIALFVKSLRVYLLVSHAGLKKVKISTAQVVMFTSSIFAVQVLFMVISTGVSPHFKAMRITTDIAAQDTHIFYCTSKYPALDYVLYAFEACILLLAAKLCYDTKDLPDAINETKVVAFSVFFVVVVCAVGFPLVLATGLDPYLQEMVTGACFASAVLYTTVVYFGPKLNLLRQGADLNAKFQIVYKNRSKEDILKQKQAAQLAAAEAEAEAERYRRFLVSVPKDAETVEGLINFLQGEIMKINMKAQIGSSGFSGSSGASSGSHASAAIVKAASRGPSVAEGSVAEQPLSMVKERSIRADLISRRSEHPARSQHAVESSRVLPED